jgi:hypothetical protein
VTYSFINILFISTGRSDDKLCPQILSVGTTANAALISHLALTYDVGNPDPGFGQAQKYGSAKLINEI